jgi:hypothetical protein
LKLVKDRNNNKTAVTIGQRNGAFPVGPDSIAQGWNVSTINGLTMARGNGSAAVGDYSYAEGKESKSIGEFSHAEGRKTVAGGKYAKSSGNESSAAGEASEASGYRAVTAQSCSGESTSSPHKSAFAWQGQKGDAERSHYHSHGDGTFNINPVPKDGDDDPASGFYIGETSLKDRLESAVEGYVKMEDLVDGLQVNEISAKGITIDGKKPSLEGHTHVVSDITDFPSQIVNSVNGDSGDVTLTGADIAVSRNISTKIDTALAGKATKADATLIPVYDGNGKKFSDWVCVPPFYEGSFITIVETPGEETGMVNYTPYCNGSAIGRTGTVSEDILLLRWR